MTRIAGGTAGPSHTLTADQEIAITRTEEALARWHDSRRPIVAPETEVKVTEALRPLWGVWGRGDLPAASI